MTAPPVIGITGRRFGAGRTFELEDAVAIQSDYCDAVERAGGLAATLAPRELDVASANDTIAALHGLVLTGGADVAPHRYGQEPHETVYGVSDLQDSFELALLDAALEAGAPVLAICRGLQLVNVAFGGELDQHITGRDGLLAHGVPNGGGGSDMAIQVSPDSLLFGAIGSEAVTGRCHHHQAVARIGDGLHVSARADDGVVEGLEMQDRSRAWLLAVQWHPEESAASDPLNQRLFDALVGRARDRRTG